MMSVAMKLINFKCHLNWKFTDIFKPCSWILVTNWTQSVYTSLTWFFFNCSRFFSTSHFFSSNSVRIFFFQKVLTNLSLKGRSQDFHPERASDLFETFNYPGHLPSFCFHSKPSEVQKSSWFNLLTIRRLGKLQIEFNS